MTAAAFAIDSYGSPPSPMTALELFAVRADELAQRVHENKLPFLEAVDMAYSAAVWAGLVDESATMKSKK